MWIRGRWISQDYRSVGKMPVAGASLSSNLASKSGENQHRYGFCRLLSLKRIILRQLAIPKADSNQQNAYINLLSQHSRIYAVENTPATEDKDIQISFLQLLKSTMSAFIGVQSNANRERDFKHGKISHFIGIGLLFGLLFICTIVGVVPIVIHTTGSN